jgi:tripartite-type tricarboxylate transporter receptor subunit TctC
MIAEQTRRTVFSRAWLAALVGLCIAAPCAQAQPVADFYRGKTLSPIVGTSAGNDYDFRGRLIARHIGRHIPGEPTIVPRNMPGAGGGAANWLTNVHRGGTTVARNDGGSECVGLQH